MKMTIGTKLMTMFGGAMFFVTLVSAIVYRQTTGMIETSDWVNHTHVVLSTIEELLSLLKDAETGQRGFLITGEQRYLEPYEESIPSVDEKIQKLRTLVADNPNQVQRVDSIAPLVQKKLAELKDTVNVRRTQSFDAARTIVLSDLGKTTMDAMRQIMRDMVLQEETLLKARDSENKAKADATKNTLLFGILLCLLILLLAAFVIVKHISGPLNEIALLAEQMSTGVISVQVPYQARQDEIGILAKSFNKMVQYFEGMAGDLAQISQRNLTVNVKPESDKDVIGNSLLNMVAKLRSIMADLKEGASVLGSSTSEILAVVSQVAAGAIETASAVNETTATVEEVKQTAFLSNQRAKGVSDHAKLAAEISLGGKKAVEASVEGMNQIKSRMELITENIVKLSDRSQAIGEIISAVNDLAEQSNLLAVNASIEAARAGEQGRGFMVVAQEVKILADQSKQATAQVRNILNEIQKATSSAVLAAEQGTKAVESGMLQADESGRSILALNEKVIQAAHAALQIANSSDQQVSGVSQVATAMENIKQASSQNVQGTKQVELAAQNLNRLGLNLKALVEQFTI